jgi:hypothetical protein
MHLGYTVSEKIFMYIDWHSKQVKTTLRFIGYGLMTIMTVITATVLIYLAKGYRFDRKTGQIIQNGLILVDTKPVSASIFINGTKRDSTPARYELPAGRYDLKLAANGYRTWEKFINLAGSYVEWVHYPVLFPSSIETQPEVSLPSVEFVSASQDHKTILLRQKADKTNLATLYQSDNPSKTTVIPFSSVITTKPDNIGQFSVVEWSLDNHHVLIRHIIGKTTEYLALDVGKPSQMVNLSKLTGAKLVDPHFNRTDGSKLYAIVGANLKRFDLKASPVTSQTLIYNVNAYKPYGDDTILFAAKSSSNPKNVDEGVLKGTKPFVIRSMPAGSRQYLLGYISYSGDDYFVAGESDNSQVSIYKNPLSNNEDSRTVFEALPIQSPRYLSFSDNGQFVAVQDGQHFAVYDLDNYRSYIYDSPLKIPENKQVTWMDGSHLIATLSGKVYVWDYDNTNLQQLITAQDGYPVMFDSNYQRMWSIGKSSSGLSLQLSSMLADKHPSDLLPK